MNRRMHFGPLAAALALLMVAPRLGAQTLPYENESEPSGPSSGPPVELRYGVYGDFNLNKHSADFRAIPGVPNCCPLFESGSGTGFSAGLFYEIPLAPKSLRGLALDLRAGYGSYNGTLKETETTVVDHEGAVVDGAFEHTIDAKIGTIGIEPLVGYRFAGGFIVRIGGRVAYVLQPTYAQKEVLTQPTTGTFAGTGSRIRNAFTGDLPNASALSAGLLGGISYELPLNRSRTIMLAPEVLYGIGLTPLVKGLKWNVGGLRAGLALVFAPFHSPSIEPPPPSPPVVDEAPVMKTPALAAMVSATGIRADGTEEPRATLRVEEFLSTRLRPLLNYLFFDEGSATIPARYHALAGDQTKEFFVEKLYNEETLPTYHDLLNIIGRRMIENPRAAITIVGCNSDQGIERGNSDLSNRRAAVVRDYLRDVWAIPEARMKLESRALPEIPSNIRDTDGVVENRRTEIHSDTWEIVAPVMTHDTLRSVDVPALRFYPHAQAETGAAHWNLVAMQGDRTLHEFSGDGMVPDRIDWKIGDDKESIPRGADAVTYQLHVRDASGATVMATNTPIPVEQITVQKKRHNRIADKEIDRFSLILFNFDNATMGDANRRIVHLISDYLKPTSTATITGHTDRMGADEYNRKLSELRAKGVAGALNVAQASASGAGEADALYDNDLPEGRFYNRTVEIEVQTPVEEGERR